MTLLVTLSVRLSFQLLDFVHLNYHSKLSCDFFFAIHCYQWQARFSEAIGEVDIVMTMKRGCEGSTCKDQPSHALTGLALNGGDLSAAGFEPLLVPLWVSGVSVAACLGLEWDTPHTHTCTDTHMHANKGS